MPDYSKLVRKMEWEGDVLHVHDVVKEISDNMEKQTEEVVLNHFDCDFSDFREYMHDKIKWEQKQWAAMPHWTPVTEGLPKRPENWPRCELRRCYFLVALESGCVKSLGFEFATMEWHTVGSPVTHWMPLPEPPKGEKED